MLLDYETLKLVWWVLIGALLIGFAVTDGMDMGVGILLPFLGKSDTERRVVINVVAPHWDGNQVWLITAGGAIFAAWPAVYAAAFSGFYLAMFLVLAGLFLRPVGFDYRSKVQDPRWRSTWDWGLFVGGLVPALIFGVAFGNLLQGIPFHLDTFLKPHYDHTFIWALLPLLNPFALLAGILSVCMVAMHGGLWLQLRTEGVIAERARAAVGLLAPIVTVLFLVGGVWVYLGIDGFRIVSQPDLNAMPNPLAKEVVRAPGAWFDIYRTMPITMVVPALGLLAPLLVWMLSRVRRPGLGCFASGLALTGVIGTAGLSLFPFVMPSSTNPNSSLTVWDAASSHLTLTVMFWAVVIFLPIVLLYTIWCYYQMWGKTTVKQIEDNTYNAY
ncbi:cytochrome bd-I ubiquinol oxidase subunit 2 apoprotein [Breoghania corrubedonensis]|uniref:Cytochrome bd-I ubiquinol oxidase subunit 2 apoprotein n=1 Tax=Breoghania corrubedonensis TaxID=665038 RepID=A0A2T5VA77_9HYPH|nr:cytochrome d ubiquinol oxidase subunit II [Breoghania corrubedonensis]PTW60653.1 cytochrome bd-I ubiquinol oxidase subunit 2 apoprotein [Breoghania corrubedonensis]